MATTVNIWSSTHLSDYKSHDYEALKMHEPSLKDNRLLLQKIELLQAMVDKLESEKDSLTYSCSDLKQLLQCVTKQHDKEAERQRKTIKDLEKKAENLECALFTSELYSAHLCSLGNFWQDVINE